VEAPKSEGGPGIPPAKHEKETPKVDLATQPAAVPAIATSVASTAEQTLAVLTTTTDVVEQAKTIETLKLQLARLEDQMRQFASHAH
jgi:uncharacterized coiled-coil protein SlyX